MARRLAAILAADVVGYSALMAQDEAGALATLKAHRAELFDPEIERHGGRIVKLMGDGALVEFPSVVDAVASAIAIQSALAGEPAGRIRLRIGVHLGDVIPEGDDIYGDGVNIAARLEALAEPGGICVSAMVRDSLGNRVEAGFADAGEHTLKNIPQPVRVFHWTPGTKADTKPDTSSSLSDNPSIAVLPFTNMSGDPEQQYFADGIAEDVITALSRFHDLLVIARNSSFTYRDSSTDVRQVGRELNVRYVLEGSVRTVGGRVRITAQLVETSTGNHVWAEHFDRPLEDVFEVQDEITALVASTVGQRVRVEEIKSALKRDQQDLRARDLIARAQWHMDRMTPADFAKARELAEATIHRHPGVGSAYSMLAYVSIMELVYGWGTRSPSELIGDATEAALTAIRIDPDDEAARTYLAMVYWLSGKHDSAIEECEAVLRQNSNFSGAIGTLGGVYAFSGADSYESAVETLEKAIRLSPNDPRLQFYFLHRGIAEFLVGRYDEAIEWYQKAFQRNPDLPSTLRVLISAYALSGDLEKADQIKAKFLKQNPSYSIEDAAQRLKQLMRNPEDFEHYMRGLRLAGIPERRGPS